ncbi:hypothetical protein ACFZAU_36755 [Streptomyces sp. NPDC008238]
MTRPELTELDHLREVERLARAVVSAAGDESWLSYLPEPQDATALQRAVNALARSIRHYHFPGDGCVDDEDRPDVRLVGVVILRPGAMPAEWTETYDAACARLGVEARPEGWALWNTWSDGGMPATMVVSADDTTEGLLRNWSRGRAALPVLPLPSQVALVHQGWNAPMVLSPAAAHRTGLSGRP